MLGLGLVVAMCCILAGWIWGIVTARPYAKLGLGLSFAGFALFVIGAAVAPKVGPPPVISSVSWPCALTGWIVGMVQVFINRRAPFLAARAPFLLSGAGYALFYLFAYLFFPSQADQ